MQIRRVTNFSSSFSPFFLLSSLPLFLPLLPFLPSLGQMNMLLLLSLIAMTAALTSVPQGDEQDFCENDLAPSGSLTIIRDASFDRFSGNYAVFETMNKPRPAFATDEAGWRNVLTRARKTLSGQHGTACCIANSKNQPRGGAGGHVDVHCKVARLDERPRLRPSFRGSSNNNRPQTKAERWSECMKGPRAMREQSDEYCNNLIGWSPEVEG